jgi:hypothetical protein
MNTIQNAIEDVEFLVCGASNRELGNPLYLFASEAPGWSELRIRKPFNPDESPYG